MKPTELRQMTTEALRTRADELFVQIMTLRTGGQEREKNVKKRVMVQ